MKVAAKLRIKSNHYLYQYLQENSNWYKYLNRNPDSVNEMEEEMKVNYKLTTKDKIDKVKDTLSLVESFIDIMS